MYYPARFVICPGKIDIHVVRAAGDIERVEQYNWAKHVFNATMDDVATVQKAKREGLTNIKLESCPILPQVSHCNNSVIFTHGVTQHIDVYISFMKHIFYLDKIMGPPMPMQSLYVPRSKAYSNDKLLAQINHITKAGSWSLYEKFKLRKVIFLPPIGPYCILL